MPEFVCGDEYPRWSAVGDRLYYRASGKLRVATIVVRSELAVTRREVVPGGVLSDDEEYKANGESEPHIF